MLRLRAGLFLGAALLLLLVAIPARAHVGTGVVVDAEGRVYFTDPLRNRLWRLERDARLTLLGEDIHADGLALAADGTLYVFGLRLWRVPPGADRAEIFASPEPALGDPWTVDREGNFYFLRGDCREKQGSQLWKKPPGGAAALLAGSDWGQADGQGSVARFTCLNGWAWAPDGTLYVRDGETIRRVAPDGTVTTVPGGAEAGAAQEKEYALVRTMGFAVDARGNLYVANYWKRAVLKVTPEEKVSAVLESGWPWVPAGVAAVGDELYVVENLGNFYGPSSVLSAVSWIGFRARRLRRVAADGTVTTLVRVGRQ